MAPLEELMDPDRKALARKLLLGVGGFTIVATISLGTYNAITNRPPKFARIVAEDLPADTVGMVAVADPTRGLELFDAALSSEIRAKLDEQLGFDPLLTSSWIERGFDIEAPVGLGLTSIERPVFVLTLGLADADKARTTIHEHADKLHIDGWSDRDFAGVDGMWLDEPPVAVLFRGDRMLVVATEQHDADAVEDTAEELAELRRRTSLATARAFGNIQRFPGDPLLLMFANVGELNDMALAAATFGTTDIETMAFALTSDNRDIHLVSQTIFNDDDADYLRYAKNRDRRVKTLDRVPGPVYAGLHWSIDPQYFVNMLDGFGRFGRGEIDQMQREAERELGVSVRDELLAAWTGEFGLLWTSAGDEDWGGIAFAKVRDETAAEQLLERVWSRTKGDERKPTDDGTLYTWNERPPAAAKVYDGQVWLGVGESRLAEVGDDAKGFRKTSEADAIADVVTSGSMGVAFVDLVELRRLLRSVPDRDRVLDPYADVIDELEALTMRSTVDGRTFIWTMTLHTTTDDAFDTLSKRLIEDVVEESGEALFDELAAQVPLGQ